MFSFDLFLRVTDFSSKDNVLAQGILSENAAWICKKGNRFAVKQK